MQYQLCFKYHTSLQNPVDPGEACPGPSGNITQHQIRFQTGSVVNTENVNIAECTARKCSHTFEPSSNPPLSYDRVSVAAENVVGVGAARTCTTHTISELNIDGLQSCVMVKNTMLFTSVHLEPFLRCMIKRYDTDFLLFRGIYSLLEFSKFSSPHLSCEMIIRSCLFKGCLCWRYTISKEYLVFFPVKGSLILGPDSRVDFFKVSFHSYNVICVHIQVRITMS